MNPKSSTKKRATWGFGRERNGTMSRMRHNGTVSLRGAGGNQSLAQFRANPLALRLSGIYGGGGDRPPPDRAIEWLLDWLLWVPW